MNEFWVFPRINYENLKEIANSSEDIKLKMSARNSRRPTPTTQIVNFIHTCCSHNLPTYHSYFVCTSQEKKLLFNEFALEHFFSVTYVHTAHSRTVTMWTIIFRLNYRVVILYKICVKCVDDLSEKDASRLGIFALKI